VNTTLTAPPDGWPGSADLFGDAEYASGCGWVSNAKIVARPSACRQIAVGRAQLAVPQLCGDDDLACGCTMRFGVCREQINLAGSADTSSGLHLVRWRSGVCVPCDPPAYARLQCDAEWHFEDAARLSSPIRGCFAVPATQPTIETCQQPSNTISAQAFMMPSSSILGRNITFR
jgi:hypothetical protein